MDPVGVEPTSVNELEKDLYTLVPFFVRPPEPQRTGFPIDFSTYCLGRKQVDRRGLAGFDDGFSDASRSHPESVVALFIKQPLRKKQCRLRLWSAFNEAC
jgi:hypothetical protein